MLTQPASISLTVNEQVRESTRSPDTPLARVLREEFGLTGTKIGCGAGECGACTVLIDRMPICSCLIPLGRCEGVTVRTIEGLSREDGPLHPVQQALVESGAFQCGYCTPGIVMTLVALAESDSDVDETRLRLALQGHVCRCSGYAKLLDAGLRILRMLREGGTRRSG